MMNPINKIGRIVKNIINSRKPIQVAEYSQPYALSCRAKHAGLTHDQKAIVDIGTVRIEKDWNTKIPTIYFCPTDMVEVKKVLQSGDGGGLPQRVQIIDIKPPKGKYSGQYFTLKNVMLHSNGIITITPIPETEWVKQQSQVW